MRPRDPLANPGPLIRRVYAYVAYRLGDGPLAEDVTSDTIERALHYRESYDPQKGEPLTWLIGIARHRIADAATRDREICVAEPVEAPAPGDLEDDTARRLAIQSAVEALSVRDRELLALRYGADLSTRQIGALLDLQPKAVEVALRRARLRLRERVEGREGAVGFSRPQPVPGVTER